MIEKEISETYYFNPADYNQSGRRISDGERFRDVIKGFEREFHRYHSTEYALNLYANYLTMDLLSKSCDATPNHVYGMDLTQGRGFDAKCDPYYNHQMDIYSSHIMVYAIDSAFMDVFENGYPVIDDEKMIYPLTLLIDNELQNGVIRLSVPTIDDGDDFEPVTVDNPKFEYA